MQVVNVWIWLILYQDAGLYLKNLIPPVLTCFYDQDSRVRYYACEALYNIAKVARGSVLPFFNDVFDGLSKVSIMKNHQGIKLRIHCTSWILGEQINYIMYTCMIHILSVHVYLFPHTTVLYRLLHNFYRMALTGYIQSCMCLHSWTKVLFPLLQCIWNSTLCICSFPCRVLTLYWLKEEANKYRYL